MKTKVLIGCSGSVATIKMPLLATTLQNNGYEVQIVVTKCARHFFNTEEIPEGACLWKDEDEWEAWTDRGDPVLHIELGKWADIFVIAPLDANTLSKLSTGNRNTVNTSIMAEDIRGWFESLKLSRGVVTASLRLISGHTKYHLQRMSIVDSASYDQCGQPETVEHILWDCPRTALAARDRLTVAIRQGLGYSVTEGLCDNLLTCVARAWDLKKPFLFCPAMNTRMYNHPLTEEQINKLKSFGYFEIPVVSKTLMCGESGLGAMAEVSTIVEAVRNHLS